MEKIGVALVPQWRRKLIRISSTFLFAIFSVNVSPYTLAKLVAKSVTLVGNSTVWSMVSNLMVKCPLTRPLEEVMTHSIPFSLRPEPANTCQGE